MSRHGRHSRPGVSERLQVPQHRGPRLQRSGPESVRTTTRPPNEIAISVIEAVTNAIEHGNRECPDENVRIVFHCKDDRLCVEVEDCGKGFDYECYLKNIPDPTNLQHLPGKRHLYHEEHDGFARFRDGARQRHEGQARETPEAESRRRRFGRISRGPSFRFRAISGSDLYGRLLLSRIVLPRLRHHHILSRRDDPAAIGKERDRAGSRRSCSSSRASGRSSARSAFSSSSIRARAPLLFKNLVASFDYVWEFFFPSLVLFALVYPRRHRAWPWMRQYRLDALSPAPLSSHPPHLSHAPRESRAHVSRARRRSPVSVGAVSAFLERIGGFLNVFMALLLKAHVQLFSIVDVAYAAFSMILLVGAMRSDLSPRVKRQVRVLLGGLGLCIVTFSLARLVPSFAGAEERQDISTAFINASLIIGGGSIAFAIVRYQLLDMRLIARRGILYVAAAAVSPPSISSSSRRSRSLFSRFSGGSVEILETGFIILFIIAFQPVLGRIEEWSERFLVREQHNPRARIRALSSELLTMIDVSAMKERISAVLADVFETKEAQLVLAKEVLEESGGDPDVQHGRSIRSPASASPSRVRIFSRRSGILSARKNLLRRRRKKFADETRRTCPPACAVRPLRSPRSDHARRRLRRGDSPRLAAGAGSLHRRGARAPLDARRAGRGVAPQHSAPQGSGREARARGGAQHRAIDPAQPASLRAARARALRGGGAEHLEQAGRRRLLRFSAPAAPISRSPWRTSRGRAFPPRSSWPRCRRAFDRTWTAWSIPSSSWAGSTT